MKRTTVFLSLIALALSAPGQIRSQAAPAPAVQVAPKTAAAPRLPSYKDVYCAGFITERVIQPDLFVVSGDESGLMGLYTERDVIYLNRGAGFVVNPGGEYIMIRRVVDPVKRAVFDGQPEMIKKLGTVYAEVGRIKVTIVHQQTVTATVLNACQEIQPGDVAVPFNQRPMPQITDTNFDRFAPPSGKNEGMIITSKEFASVLGTNDVAYLNIGTKQGVAVGQTYRIFRPYAAVTMDPTRRPNDYPTHMTGMRQLYHLTREQRMALPRDILGQMVILTVEGNTAVGLITMAGGDIYLGDMVELP